MPMNLHDPRVIKTRRGLQTAFVRLILKQGYDSVSIQDITDEAETARVTFYRHYRDKEELLTDCLNTLYEELVEKMGRLTAEGLLSGSAPINVFYDHLEEQEQLYHILFSSRGTQTAVERLRDFIAENVVKTIRQAEQATPVDIPIEIMAYHIASAQIGLGIWWLDHGKPYPATYMAQVALWLSLNGLLKALNLADFEMPVPRPSQRG